LKARQAPGRYNQGELLAYGLVNLTPGGHRVGVGQGDDFAPQAVGQWFIDRRFADGPQCPFLLGRSRTRLAVKGHGTSGEVTHEHSEDRVDHIGVEVEDLGLLQDELTVDDEGE